MHRENKWRHLPLSIKLIIWIYLILNLLLFTSILLKLIGIETPMGLYGLFAENLFSTTGILIFLLFSLKGIVALAFIRGYHSAVELGLLDAFLGIVICIIIGFVYPFYDDKNSVDLVFRIELLILVPLLFTLYKIRKNWKSPLLKDSTN